MHTVIQWSEYNLQSRRKTNKIILLLKISRNDRCPLIKNCFNTREHKINVLYLNVDFKNLDFI